MSNNRLESLGLALLAVSLALFLAAQTMPGTRQPTVPGQSEAARSVAIAMRARAEGRAAQADSLLASVAARASSESSGQDPVESAAWFAWFTFSLGFAGLCAVVLVARRRRRTIRLVAAELQLTDGDENPGRLVGSIFQLRASGSDSRLRLRHALSRLDAIELVAPARSDEPDTQRQFEPPAEPGGPDPVPGQSFPRIVAISAMDVD